MGLVLPESQDRQRLLHTVDQDPPPILPPYRIHLPLIPLTLTRLIPRTKHPLPRILVPVILRLLPTLQPVPLPQFQHLPKHLHTQMLFYHMIYVHEYLVVGDTVDSDKDFAYSVDFIFVTVTEVSLAVGHFDCLGEGHLKLDQVHRHHIHRTMRLHLHISVSRPFEGRRRTI